MSSMKKFYHFDIYFPKFSQFSRCMFCKKQNHYLDHNICSLFFASLQKYFIPEHVVAVILTIELKSVGGCKYV